MTLEQFRKNKGWSYQKLAEMLGCNHATIARRWCLPVADENRKIPHPRYMARIVDLTSGAVQPNSFYVSARD